MQKVQKVIICLTVDWEGEHFRNLHDLKSLLGKYASDVPVTHYICPAYFTSKIRHASKQIANVVRQQDEVALHLHAYKSLIRYCGIAFRTEHNYYKKHLSDMLSFFPRNLRNIIKTNLVSGRGVPLGIYTDDEIDTMIKKTVLILKQELNRQNITGFRAGGWLLRDQMFPLLANHGFTYDSSAVPPCILSQGFSKKNPGDQLDDYGYRNGYFTELVSRLWGGQLQNEKFLCNRKIVNAAQQNPIQKTTQPFMIDSIIEMPNNAGLSDFASAEKSWIPMLHKGMEAVSWSGRPFFINFGCHQEGLAKYKLAVAEFMQHLTNFKEHIQFMTVQQASLIALQQF